MRGKGGGGLGLGLGDLFWSPKHKFSALRATVWSKNKGGEGLAPRGPSLDPPLTVLTHMGRWENIDIRGFRSQ